MPDSKKELSRRHWLETVSTASLATALLIPCAAAAQGSPDDTPKNTGTGVYNIRDFGARGDGQTMDTQAIQDAIDACARDNGGTVLVPAGIFVTGTIELKSNITLRIAAGGKLLGSGDGRQYYAADAIPLNGEWTMGDGNVALIFAAHASNITIEGPGTIDGQGAQFRSATRGAMPPAGITGNKRPHHLLFYQCTNLKVRNLFLADSAYHSVRVCVCRSVQLEGIHIHSRVNHNNDGFHLISNQYVHISNCDVECQDDACALFGSNRFVTVANCSFSTRWSVFRFGGGFSENITVSDCLIYETYGCPIKMRCDSRSRFENISFSNIVMKDVTGPVSIGLGPQRRQAGMQAEKPGIVRNISFSHIRATVAKPVQLRDSPVVSAYNPGEMYAAVILNGMDDGFLENVSFTDVHICFPGGGTAEQGAVRDVPKIAGEYFAIGIPPAYGLYARNVKKLVLNNVQFRIASPDLRPAMVWDQVTDATVDGLSVDGNKGAESVLRLTNTQDIWMTAVRLRNEASVFLRAEGASCNNIVLEGTSITQAKSPFALFNGAPPAAIAIRD